MEGSPKEDRPMRVCSVECLSHRRFGSKNCPVGPLLVPNRCCGIPSGLFAIAIAIAIASLHCASGNETR